MGNVIISNRTYGIGTTQRVYYTDQDNNSDRKSWQDMTDRERQESNYRSNVSHIRNRLRTRVLSSQYLFHVVFTTTDSRLQRDITAFRDVVVRELDRQDINYCLFPELYHKENIWLYDDEAPTDTAVYMDGYRAAPKDSVINAYGCYNRRAFAPLSKENAWHIHVMTDKPVNFLHYIQTVECNPDNLYCELFCGIEDYLFEDKKDEDYTLSKINGIKMGAQIKNLNYMVKLLFYSKAKLPNNFRFLKTNNKKIEVEKENIIVDEYGEIVDRIYNTANNYRNRITKAVFSNIEDYKLNPDYQKLDEFKKVAFEIDYIRDLYDLNKKYQDIVDNYLYFTSLNSFKYRMLLIYNIIEAKKIAKINRSIKILKTKKKKAPFKQFLKDMDNYFLYHSVSFTCYANNSDKNNGIDSLNLDIFIKNVCDIKELKEFFIKSKKCKVLNPYKYGVNLESFRKFFKKDFENNSDSKLSNSNYSNPFKNIDLDDVFEYNFWDLMLKNYIQNNKVESNNSTDFKNGIVFYNIVPIVPILNNKRQLSIPLEIKFRKYLRYKYRRLFRFTYNRQIKTTVGIYNTTPVFYNHCLITLPWILHYFPTFFILSFFSYLLFMVKSVTLEYRGQLLKAKKYALVVRNRLSGKQFRRKKRRLQVKKSPKSEYNQAKNLKKLLGCVNCAQNLPISKQFLLFLLGFRGGFPLSPFFPE